MKKELLPCVTIHQSIHTNLIHCWGDLCGRKQLLELLGREIADADHLSKAQPMAFLHCPPDAGQVQWHDVLPLHREVGLARLYSHGPVNQVQINVLHLKVPADEEIKKKLELHEPDTKAKQQ